MIKLRSPLPSLLALFLLALLFLLPDIVEAEGFFHKLQKKVFSPAPKPLTDEARVALAARHTKGVDDAVWKRELERMKSGDAEGEMWFLWFVEGGVEVEEDEVKMDGRYNDTIISIAQILEKRKSTAPNNNNPPSSPPPKPNFGRINCSHNTSTPLCFRFFTVPKCLPKLFLLVPSTTLTEVEYTHDNETLKRPEIVETTTVRLWKFPLNDNTTSEEIVEFYEKEGWRELRAWDGWLNPVDGVLSAVGEYVGLLYRWYKAVPQWALMMGIGLLAKHITSKLIPVTPSPNRERKEKKEKEKKEKKERKERKGEQPLAPTTTNAVNGRVLRS